jgi:hypothetical protein
MFCFFSRRFNGKFKLLALVSSMAVVFISNPTVSAAIVAYDSYADYQNAALMADLTNTETIVDFEAFSPGSGLPSSVGDTTFSSDFGFGSLRVWSGGDSTVSPGNYIGNGAFSPASAQRLSDQPVQMSFGALRSAAGIFIVPEAGASQVSLTIGGNTINVNTANIFLTPNMNDAYFIGFVDDTGTNSIASMTLQGAASARYYFDNLTTFSAVAVPEPNLMFAMSVVAGGWMVRRRRNQSKAT